MSTYHASYALLPVTLAALFAADQAPPQKFHPAPVQASSLTIRLERAGRMSTHVNPTSPAAAGAHLLLIDQAGTVDLWDGASTRRVLGPQDTPAGLKLVGHERVLNAAASADGTKVYVVFVSSTAPAGVPRRISPRAQSDDWYVPVEFAFDGERFSSPRPLAALAMRVDGHTGGGLAVLPDGSLIFAAGDNGDSYEDGRDYSQDPTTHLAKIVRITPTTGAITIVALGIRIAQRLTVSGQGDDARVHFVDPGGWVSEELNSVRVADLLGSRGPVNFGWGRSAADGRAREGTFFIGPTGNAVAPITDPVPGFLDPVAEFGREGATAVAISGPAARSRSLKTISLLFGDLVSGKVFAVTGPPAETSQPVFQVGLVDERGKPVTLWDLAGGRRPDPRFFTFPAGTAGVLLEATGEFFRLIEG